MHFFPLLGKPKREVLSCVHLPVPGFSCSPVLGTPQASLGCLQPSDQSVSIYLLKTHFVPSTINRKRTILCMKMCRGGNCFLEIHCSD